MEMGVWICAANGRRTVNVNLSIGRGGVFREDSIATSLIGHMTYSPSTYQEKHIITKDQTSVLAGT